MRTGSKAIGGVNASEVRRQEGLKVTPAAAYKELKAWKSLGKWITDEGDESLATAFQFGVSCIVRQTAVLERSAPGKLLNPTKVYGMRDEAGSLRVSPQVTGKPATIHFWYELPYEQLLAKLRADASSLGVVLYDRLEWHYDPLVRADADDVDEEVALLNAAAVLVEETVAAAPETSAAVAAPKRKRAANRASEVVEVSCAPPAKRVALTEATLEEALAAGKFSRLVPIESAPASVDALNGSLVAFRWQVCENIKKATHSTIQAHTCTLRITAGPSLVLGRRAIAHLITPHCT